MQRARGKARPANARIRIFLSLIGILKRKRHRKMWGVSVGQFKCQRPKTFSYSHSWPSSFQPAFMIFLQGTSSMKKAFVYTWFVAARLLWNCCYKWLACSPAHQFFTLGLGKTNIGNKCWEPNVQVTHMDQNCSRSSNTIQQLLINAAVLVWNHVKHLGFFGCRALGVLAICPTKVRQDTCTVTQPVEGPDPLRSW